MAVIIVAVSIVFMQHGTDKKPVELEITKLGAFVCGSVSIATNKIIDIKKAQMCIYIMVIHQR